VGVVVWAVLALELGATAIPGGRSERPPSSDAGFATTFTATAPTPAAAMTRAFYALSELGDDPSLGEWAAGTIPAVVRPESWGGTPAGKPSISYHAPTRVLVVYHTAAAQAEVAAFLKDLKTATTARKGRAAPGVATP